MCVRYLGQIFEENCQHAEALQSLQGSFEHKPLTWVCRGFKELFITVLLALKGDLQGLFQSSQCLEWVEIEFFAAVPKKIFLPGGGVTQSEPCLQVTCKPL